MFGIVSYSEDVSLGYKRLCLHGSFIFTFTCDDYKLSLELVLKYILRCYERNFGSLQQNRLCTDLELASVSQLSARSTGDQEAASSIPAGSGNILS